VLRHDPDQVPYTNPQSRRYFKRIPAIEGDDEVCYNGAQFTSVLAQDYDISWTVSDPSIFYVSPTGNPTYVNRIGTGTSSVPIYLYVYDSSGKLIGQKEITACSPAILTGADDIPLNVSELYTLSGIPFGTYVSWFVSTNSFTRNPSTGFSTTVTRTGSGDGTLTARNMYNHTIISKSFPSHTPQTLTYTTSPPANSGTITVDNGCSDIVIQNVTVNSGVTLHFITCGDIMVNNVTVVSGGSLILDAGGEAIINEIDVQLGAEYEIK